MTIERSKLAQTDFSEIVSAEEDRDRPISPGEIRPRVA